MSMHKRIVRTGMLALFAAAAFASTAAWAEWDFGVRGGLYTDEDDAFVGAEGLMDMTKQWYFNPNVEYVFVSDADQYSLNSDFHWDFNQKQSTTMWVGGGPALLRHDNDQGFGTENDDTDVGMNVLFGFGSTKGG